MMQFFFTIGFLLAIIGTSDASSPGSQQYLDDPKRTITYGHYRGNYSLEMDLKALAERAVGHSLTKGDIERYTVVKKEFERHQTTFSSYEQELCLSRIATIEEALKESPDTHP